MNDHTQSHSVLTSMELIQRTPILASDRGSTSILRTASPRGTLSLTAEHEEDSIQDDIDNYQSLESPNLYKQEPHISIKRLSTEIFSLLLAAASLAGFFILLKRYDHKPSPQWTVVNRTGGVTLNTVASFVSLVFRSCLLMPVAHSISQLAWVWYMQPKSLEDIVYYDSASRGPLGSIRLLFRLRFM